MAKITEIKNCRLCGESKLRAVLPLHPTPVGDLYLPKNQNPEKLECFPLDVYQCASCGHVQLKAIVDPEYLYSDYIYTTSSSLGLAEHFQSYATRTVRKLEMRPGSLVVEIGSNDGTMLRGFQREGMKVIGVDPATEIAAKATQTGVPTIHGFFSVETAKKIVKMHGKADLFVANNVLANVPCPRDIFLGVLEVLKTDGVIIFETGYLKYLAEDCVFDNIYHEHIDYYSIQPLISFFESLGLQLIDVDVSDSKGSSIRCYVQREGGKHPIGAGINELCHREREIGYGTIEPYKRLSVHLEDTKKQLHKILKPLKDQGKVVAGFGASVGVTTMLYHFELEGIVDYLLDDNPVRQGRFSPGMALEVKSPKILETENRPDIILLLAWRYAGPIIKKHGKQYQNHGGQFLQLLPTVAHLKI
jgi:SAM-dependent methyltransferase